MQPARRANGFSNRVFGQLNVGKKAGVARSEVVQRAE